MSEFIGAMSKRAYIVQSLRAAFSEPEFNLCALHNLPDYDMMTFSKWVGRMHCQPATPEQTRLAQLYCVNYFLCPEGDEFDVEAVFREVWPEETEQRKKRMWRIFGWTVEVKK